MKRWVKLPVPGEMRGEGEWKDFDKSMKEWGKESQIEQEWDFLVRAKYLPTQISEEKPE